MAWESAGQSGAQDSGVGAGEEEGGSKAPVGDAIAVSVGQPFDHCVQAQAAQLVSDSALPDRFGRTAGETGKMEPDFGAAKAVGQQAEQDERVPERLDARIGEAQAGGALAFDIDGTVYVLERFLGQQTIMTEAFHLQ